MIYFRQSDRVIVAIMANQSKAHLDDAEVTAELPTMFPDQGAMDFDRFDADDAQCGGTWDKVNHVMDAPAPVKPPVPHPQKARIRQLRRKFRDDPNSVTLLEAVEFLFKGDVGKKIAGE